MIALVPFSCFSQEGTKKNKESNEMKQIGRAHV